MPEPFSKKQILDSVQYVVEHADDVSINGSALKEYGDTLPLQKVDHWLLHAPIDSSSLTQEELLNLIFVYSSLSFSYWGEPDYFYTHQGQTYKTSFALLKALAVAVEEKKLRLDLAHLATISEEEVSAIVNKDMRMPMFEDRVRILHENCGIVVKHFGGSILKLLEAGGHDTLALLAILYEYFPGYHDDAIYKGKQVFFCKKAQILLADIDRAFKPPIGVLKNANALTACADYRLPQLMRHLGILVYSDALAERIDTLQEVPPRSSQEVEIRACTIWAVDLLRNALSLKHGREVAAIDVNDYLWLTAKERLGELKPHHRTRTTTY